MTATTGSQRRVAGPFGWRTVTPLVMGSALNPVNSSVIATALVPIAAALHVPAGRTLILVSSLYLACAIAQPTAGKLAEEFGPRVGAFSTTDLDQQLKDRGITTLIRAGVSTSGVVLSTVREAADRDYHIYVLADASADRDPHVHAVLTEKVLPMQAYLITVADLPSLIVTAGRPAAATDTATKVRT